MAKKAKITIIKVVPGTSADEAAAFDNSCGETPHPHEGFSCSMSQGERAYVSSQLDQYKQGKIGTSTQTDPVIVIAAAPDTLSCGTQTAPPGDCLQQSLNEIRQRIEGFDKKCDANNATILQLLKERQLPIAPKVFPQPRQDLVVQENFGASPSPSPVPLLDRNEEEILPLAQRVQLLHSTPVRSLTQPMSSHSSASSVSEVPSNGHRIHVPRDALGLSPHFAPVAQSGPQYGNPTAESLDNCCNGRVHLIGSKSDPLDFLPDAELRISDQLCRHVKMALEMPVTLRGVSPDIFTENTSWKGAATVALVCLN